MDTTLLRRGALPVALIAGLAATAVAWAVPARTTELSSATPIFEWDSGAIFGTPAEEQAVNDDTLVKLGEAGSLTVVTSEPDDTAVDIDAYIYKADAAGEPEGDPLVEGREGGSEEKITAKGLAPGDYVVRLAAWLAADGHVHGKATFTPDAPAEPDPAVTPQPGPLPSGDGTDATPVAELAGVPKKAKAKKLKAFKGTASDDRAVAKVEVALVRAKGRKCYVMTSKGGWAKLAKCADPTIFNDASGTDTWTYSLPKKLKKGRYTVFARAIDSAGQAQAGFGPQNKRSFKIR